jgi:hypothetical protein
LDTHNGIETRFEGCTTPEYGKSQIVPVELTLMAGKPMGDDIFEQASETCRFREYFASEDSLQFLFDRL